MGRWLEIAPLAVRRRFPLAVWLTILALITAEAAVTGSNEGAGTSSGCWSAATPSRRYTTATDRGPVPAAPGARGWLIPAGVRAGNMFDDAIFVITLVGGFWIVGRVVWSRNELVLRLAEQSEELRSSRASRGAGDGRRAARADHPRRARRGRAQRLRSWWCRPRRERPSCRWMPPRRRSRLRAIQRVGRSTTMTELRGLLGSPRGGGGPVRRCRRPGRLAVAEPSTGRRGPPGVPSCVRRG